jgi:hypothetical protein
VIRQHERTEYPVSNVAVTLTDRGGEVKTAIAGGVAPGASTGARLRRLDEPAEIVVLERDRRVSFANRGLPYHIGGAIPDRAACCRRWRSPRGLRLSHTPGEQPRWAGVPFTLRSGKILPADSAEIPLHVRPLPGTSSTSVLASNRT